MDHWRAIKLMTSKVPWKQNLIKSDFGESVLSFFFFFLLIQMFEWTSGRRKKLQGFPPLVIDAFLFVFLVQGCKLHPSVSHKEHFQKPNDAELPQRFPHMGEQARRTEPLLWPRSALFLRVQLGGKPVLGRDSPFITPWHKTQVLPLTWCLGLTKSPSGCSPDTGGCSASTLRDTGLIWN